MHFADAKSIPNAAEYQLKHRYGLNHKVCQHTLLFLILSLIDK